MTIFRSKAWLQAVRELKYCVICGKHGIQAAHRNTGKGLNVKTSDCLCAALCPECHYELDNGKGLNREERREILDDAILKTIEQLALNGRLRVARS